jgi:hypothetical protein
MNQRFLKTINHMYEKNIVLLEKQICRAHLEFDEE